MLPFYTGSIAIQTHFATYRFAKMYRCAYLSKRLNPAGCILLPTTSVGAILTELGCCSVQRLDVTVSNDHRQLQQQQQQPRLQSTQAYRRIFSAVLHQSSICYIVHQLARSNQSLHASLDTLQLPPIFVDRSNSKCSAVGICGRKNTTVDLCSSLYNVGVDSCE